MKQLNFLRPNIIILILAGIAATVVSYVIINTIDVRLQKYIEDYNNKIPPQISYLMAQKAEEWIAPRTADFDLSRYDQYNRNSPRLALKRFVQRNPDIRWISLISPQNEIVISTTPNKEDQVYTDPEVLKQLDLQVPQFDLQQGQNTYEFDVLWPVSRDGEFKGYIRMAMNINQLHNLDTARKWILWGVILGVGAFIVMALWFTWQINEARGLTQSMNPKPQKEVEEKEVEKNKKSKSEGSVFSKLSDVFGKGDEIEQSFQQSEQKAHNMMRVLNQGLLILDNNMHILASNDYVLDVFGIRIKKNPQRRIYEILQKNPRLLEIYRRSKNPRTLEVKQNVALRLMDKRVVNVEVLAQPFMNGDDGIAGVTFYFKNVDMLSELEQTLQRSMKYGVISQLSSSIGHEIRNPLSSLAIHTEIVDTMVERSVANDKQLGKIKRSIHILNSEVERLNKLIDQFFNLAKAQEIKLSYENLNEMMSEIFDLTSQQALEKNIDIQKAFAEELPMVKVSKDQLKQVVINIILNAFDAMENGGSLILKTESRDGYVVIAITDSGGGIPDRIKEHIFDLYFTTKATGGGIGLAISKKLIEAHEGNLYFRSKPDAGTTFFIELPTSF